MKKFLTLILAGLLILTACSKSTEKSETPKKETTESSKQTEDTKQAEKTDDSSNKADEPSEKADEPAEKADENESETNVLELGKPVKLGDYTVTVKELKLVKDYKNRDAIKIVYSWENGSKKTNAPYMTIDFVGYQDGVETDRFFSSDDVDFGISQKDVKPKGKIDNAEDALIVDVSKPLELELKESLSLDDKVYTLKIEDLSKYK